MTKSPVASLQAWLQHKPWPLWRIGNGISAIRFFIWQRFGGRLDA